jgi:hypothetical protein
MLCTDHLLLTMAAAGQMPVKSLRTSNCGWAIGRQIIYNLHWLTDHQ